MDRDIHLAMSREAVVLGILIITTFAWGSVYGVFFVATYLATRLLALAWVDYQNWKEGQ